MGIVNEETMSFLNKIKFLDSKKKISRGLRLLIVGLTKTGKTYFSGTAPSPFIIDTDGSLNGLPEDKENIPYLSLRVGTAVGRNWTLSVNGTNQEDFNPFYLIDELLRELGENNCKIEDYKVQTIVFDGLTSLADLFMFECLLDKKIGQSSSVKDASRNPLTQKATFDEYLALEARLSLLFTKVDDLGLNIIATAGLKMDRDEVSGTIQCFPDILGGFRHDVGHRFDGAVILSNEKLKHFMHIGEYAKFIGGIRRWHGPDKIESPTWDKIVEFIGKKKTQP